MHDQSSSPGFRCLMSHRQGLIWSFGLQWGWGGIKEKMKVSWVPISKCRQVCIIHKNVLFGYRKKTFDHTQQTNWDEKQNSHNLFMSKLQRQSREISNMPCTCMPCLGPKQLTCTIGETEFHFNNKIDILWGSPSHATVVFMGVLKIIYISLKRGKYKIDIKKSKSHKLQSTIPKLRLKIWKSGICVYTKT